MLSQVGKVSGSRIAPVTNSSTTTIASAYSWNSSFFSRPMAAVVIRPPPRDQGNRWAPLRGEGARARVAAFPSTSATISPSRITRMREQMPTSSSSSEETTSTPTPDLARSRDDPVELGLGGHVDAAGRLVEQQHAALAQQPAGEHDLLLVAAREQAHDAVGVVGHGVQRAQLLARLLALLADVEQRVGEPAEGGEAHVLRRAPVEHERLGLAVLGREAEARPRSRAAGLVGSLFPSSQTSPSSGRSRP